MSEQSAKTGELRWQWPFAISCAVHCLTAIFLWYVPDSVEFPDYSENARRYDLSHSMVQVEAYTEYGDVMDSPDVRDALSPDEDPFENHGLESVEEPVIRLEKSRRDADKDILAARREETPVIQENGLADVIESASGPDANDADSGRESAGTSAQNADTNDSSVRAGNGGSGNNEMAEGRAAGAGEADVQKHEVQSGGGAAVDLNQVWQAYTKTLSQHFKTRLHYPEMAKKLKLTGTVWVLVELKRDGSLISVQIDTSSGVEMLDEAALDAVKKSVPVPPFPEQTTDQTKKVRIPYRYKLNK